MATDEDDYLTMTFEDPAPIPQTETYSQRRARKLREHESNMQITPPKILEQERREEGLAKNMLAEKESKKESKAMRMMKLMGYTEGKGLGSEESNGKLEPLSLEMPDGRKGIGHDMDKKRKLKELYEDSLKRQKEDSDTYRLNVRSERLETGLKNNLRQAQKVCQNLDTKAAENESTDSTAPRELPNVFWRGLERDREMEQKEKRFRRRVLYERSANLLGESDDEEYDNVVQVEEEDEELDEFEALPLENQLEMILHYMREQYFYCFWCGCAYNDSEDLAENCPGLTEDDH